MPFPYSLPFPGDDGDTAGLIKITDHAAAAVSRLIEQYRDKPNIRALVEIAGERAQGLEDSLFTLFTDRWLASAVGEQLDVLGRLLKQPRNSPDDDVFRLYLQARIMINRSSGTAEDLIQLMTLVAPSGTTIELVERPPAGFRMRLHGPVDDATAAILLVFLRAARAAAVYGSLEWSNVADDNTFLLDFPDDNGIGDLADPSVGGRLAGIGA